MICSEKCANLRQKAEEKCAETALIFSEKCGPRLTACWKPKITTSLSAGCRNAWPLGSITKNPQRLHRSSGNSLRSMKTTSPSTTASATRPALFQARLPQGWGDNESPALSCRENKEAAVSAGRLGPTNANFFCTSQYVFCI